MLALVAVLLMSLFGVAALVVDLGVAGASRLELENAADALALGAPADELFDDTRAAYEEAAARGAPLALELPRLVSEPDGRQGYERRVPLVFGHGSALAFESAASGDEILRRRREGEFLPELESGGLRERGMPTEVERVLRSPRAEPAVRVGVAHPGLPGRADLALAAPCWPAAAERLVLAPAASGEALVLVAIEPAEAGPDASCARSEAGVALAPARGVQWIGDRVGVEIGIATTPTQASVAYVPLFAVDTRRVIAFARARVAAAGGGAWRVEPIVGTRAPNASALRVSTQADAALDARLAAALGERAAFRAAHAGAASAWLRAPVLAEPGR